VATLMLQSPAGQKATRGENTFSRSALPLRPWLLVRTAAYTEQRLKTIALPE